MNEQIEMYRAVQDQWKTVEVGDRVYTEKYGHGVVTNNKFNDPCFREDIEIRWDNGKYGYWCSDDPDLLWLPPPTPRWPGDEGRNLWDIAKNVLKEPLLKSFSGCDYFEIYTGSDYPWLVVASGRSLPEALLRAIERKGE